MRAPRAPDDPRLTELRQTLTDAMEESERDGHLSHEEVWRELLGDEWDKEIVELRDE